MKIVDSREKIFITQKDLNISLSQIHLIYYYEVIGYIDKYDWVMIKTNDPYDYNSDETRETIKSILQKIKLHDKEWIALIHINHFKNKEKIIEKIDHYENS